MDYKTFRKKAIFTTALTGLLYSIAAGKGPFNRMRFREQHDELAKYVDNNYPDCQYSPIVKHGRGWSSRIMRYRKTVVFVYFTKSDNGVYVFTEAKEKLQ